jgi:RNA polymerase sigma-70 factor (ECF subfamily)
MLAQRRRATMELSSPFHDEFVALFREHHPRLFRYMHRLCGDPELAADVAQETFVRLYERGSLPEHPAPWMVAVAMNLFRNDRSTRARRRDLLTVTRAEASHSDSSPQPSQHAEAVETRRLVRAALDRLPERSRALLLLHADGYTYRDIARALDINEASIGTLLARAKRAFRDAYED